MISHLNFRRCPSAVKSSAQAPRRQSGVSLIEALLALVVMALGMLGVVGVQATLRANGDLSRQRAEAVRLAQESIEEWRSFARLETQAGLDYTDVVSDAGAVNVTPLGANTSYLRTRTVDAASFPGVKSLSVTVEWADRSGVNLNANGTNQRVLLHTAVARVAPEVSMSLSVPAQGMPARQPQGRHVAIPPGAVMQNNGTSKFVPPGQPPGQTTTIVFNNLSGRISSLCTDPLNNASCTAIKAQLLSGFVRTTSGDPSALSAAQVRDPSTSFAQFAAAVGAQVLNLSAQVVNYSSSSGAAPASQTCFLDVATAPVEYFCVLGLYETSVVTDPVWSGRLAFGPEPTLVTTQPSETSSSSVRVCRYNDARAPGGDYSSVAEPLSLQNYLLIQAGNGSVAYVCPAGTAKHQPL